MSNSYSALLRRSKLGSYNPSIEQVYTSSGANLSRSNFGLKRPLPQATTAAAPFVRIQSLDNPQKRTPFRKGTKEALLVRKWDQSGIQVTSEADKVPLPAEYTTPVQSRFVPAAFADKFGGGVPQPHAALAEAHSLAGRPPSFLEMSEAQFEDWLASLTDKRDQFAAFLQKRTGASEPVSLYAAAQGAGNDLVRSLEAFLASTSPSPLLSSRLLSYPHRTLGLQYNTITPLESSFAAPVPGRILGSRQSLERSTRSGSLASVMGQLSFIADANAAGLSGTNWFPDAAGVRSNVPGRAAFRLKANVDTSAFATRVALAADRGRKPFQPRNAGTEASALADRVLQLSLDAVSPGAAPARLPGSREYSGEKAAGRKKMDAFDLGDLFNYSQRAGKGEPRQMLTRATYATNQQRRGKAARLTKERQREGEQMAGGRAGGKGSKQESLVSTLEDLLSSY